MLEVKNLYKSYKVGNKNYPVLQGVDVNIQKGEFVSVMGPSGSGKTTLLNCISNFIPYESGEVVLNGENMEKLTEDELATVRNEKLGFVFQDFMLLDGLTVFMNMLKVISEKYSQTLIVVTHDESIAQLADRVIHIRDGKIMNGVI